LLKKLNKMKYKNIILLLSISCSYSLFGQLAGYMGKRFSIGYSNYMSPAFFSAGSNSYDGFRLNATHCINIEYVRKNKRMLCASFQFLKTGINNTDFYYLSSSSGSLYPEYSVAKYKASDKKPIQLTSTNFSIGFKFFRSGFIAPVGKYTKLDFILLVEKIKFQKNAFGNDPATSAPIAIGSGVYEYNSFAIALTIGRQRCFDKIIIDTGIRFGIVPFPILKEISSEINPFDSQSPNTGARYNYNQYSNTINMEEDKTARIMGAQLINFHIGIGFIAF